MRPRIQYEVNCHPGEGECLELINASCVVLGIGPLDAIGAEVGDDLEYILSNINSRLNGLESSSTGEYAFTNIGNGAQVWAGPNSRLVGQFRTFRGGDGIEITESASEIRVGIDTDWLYDRIKGVLDDYQVIPTSVGWESMGRIEPSEPVLLSVPEPTVPEPKRTAMTLPVVEDSTEERINEIEGRIYEHLNQITNEVGKSLNVIEDKVSRSNGKTELKVNSLGSKIDKIEKVQDELSGNLEEIEKKQVSTTKEISGLKGTVGKVTTKDIPTLNAKVEAIESDVNSLNIRISKELKLKQSTTDETIKGLVTAVETLYSTIEEQNQTIRRLKNQIQVASNIEMTHKNGILTLAHKGGTTIGSIDLCEVTDSCNSVQPKWTITGKIGTSSSRDRFVLDANGPYLYRQVVDINENSPTYGQEKWVITTSS